MHIRRIASAAGIAALFVSSASAVTCYGVTDLGALTRFDHLTPESVTLVGPVTGLALGETVVGLDMRPATNELFALGSGSNLYRIDKTTGAATQIGTTFATMLNGTNFGMDFNPTVDRLRITSNTGQNLRVNPNNGVVAFVDGMLNYRADDVNAGATPDVVASAYTNSYGPAAPTSTTLYDIDRGFGTLVRQMPPNDGVLKTGGSLGITSTVTDADVLSRGGTNRLFVLAQGLTQTELYAVRVDNGSTDARGMFPLGVRVNFFAIEISSAPPAVP
ncbi:DUF4394 domain-containing protein [bacterium]|nr:MAG: DUF4394 domain-containing protein [bacterium]